jgi:hypothetical protein
LSLSLTIRALALFAGFALANPLAAQEVLDPLVLLEPTTETMLLCKPVPAISGDSAAFAYFFAIRDEEAPRVIVVTFDSAGQPRTLEIAAEIFSRSEIGVLQLIEAKFVTSDSIITNAVYVDGARIAANPLLKAERLPLALPPGALTSIRSLAEWAWKRRCRELD